MANYQVVPLKGGRPLSGFFKSREKAAQWAEQNCLGQKTLVVKVNG